MIQDLADQVKTKDTPIMCRNVSPTDRRGNFKDSWPCTTTNAGLFGKFKKTTPCVPGDDPSKHWENMQRRKALVKLWNRESFVGVAPTLPALPGGCNVAAEVEKIHLVQHIIGHHT